MIESEEHPNQKILFAHQCNLLDERLMMHAQFLRGSFGVSGLRRLRVKECILCANSEFLGIFPKQTCFKCCLVDNL